MSNNIFHLWITLPNPFNEVQIIKALVNCGYDVNPADSSGKISNCYDNATSIIALQVSKDMDDKTKLRQEILDNIDNALSNLKIKYYSIVVSTYSIYSTWLSNYNKQEEFLIKPEKKNEKPN